MVQRYSCAAPKAQRMLCGNYHKESKPASLYQGELIGFVAIHTILLALCLFYLQHHLPVTQYMLQQHCRAETVRWCWCQVKTGASRADCFCALWTIKMNHIIKVTYYRVSVHQDRHRLWWQVSLVEQLNYVCNELMKAAVI